MKKLLLVLILAGLALAGGLYWFNARREATEESVVYATGTVEYGSLNEVVSATGLVQPREVFPVGCELAGKVVAVLADFNQVVEEGDVLLRLDDRMARERLGQAELAVELARVGVRQAEATRDTVEQTVKRLRAISADVRPRAELDLAEGQLRGARATVEAAGLKVQEAEETRRQAELGLRLTTVRAPTLKSAVAAASPSSPPLDRPGTGVLAEESARPRAGKRAFVVLDRKVSLNQQIGPPVSAHLFTLAADLERMQVVAQVVEGDIHKVRRGLKARFTVSGAGEGDPVYAGKVEDVRLVPTSEHGAVYYKVCIDVRNERDAAGDWQLRPGLTASVDVIRRTHEGVWKLPVAALNFQPPPDLETEAARAKLERWKGVKGREQWQVVWVRGADHKPWPVLARTGGRDARGETGIQDGQFVEVLEWDPELQPAPDPKGPAALEVLTGTPAPKKSGLFSIPNVKF